MAPTRRDALKVAGATGALAMLGTHVAAQEDTENDEGDEQEDELPAEGEAAVSVGHLVPDAPAVNVLLDGEEVASGVNYGDFSDYLTVETGTYNVEIVAADENDVDDEDENDVDDEDENDVDEENDNDVDEENDNDVDNEDDNDADEENDNDVDDNDVDDEDDNDLDFEIPDFDDDAEENDENGVDEENGENDNDVDEDENDVEDDDNDVDEEDDNDVDEDENDVDDDENDVDDEDVVFSGEVTFEETYYTVAAIGELEADTLDVLVLQDYNVAQARLVHASPDAPAVDVTVEDTNMTLFNNVSFGQETEYVAVPPGEYTLEVRQASPDYSGDVVETFDVTLAAGKAYSGYAAGFLEEGDEEFDLLVTLDGVTTLFDHVDEELEEEDEEARNGPEEEEEIDEEEDVDEEEEDVDDDMDDEEDDAMDDDEDDDMDDE